MKGRCDTDPLDVADDVCDFCGGEFCEDCLLWPRGKKKAPVCKPCALNNSGIRGSVKTERVASRRDARKRREVLLETKGGRNKTGFVFFDESDEYEIPTETYCTTTSPTPSESTRRRISLGRKRAVDEPSEEATGEAGTTDHTDTITVTQDGHEHDHRSGAVEEHAFTPTGADGPDGLSAIELLERMRARAESPPHGQDQSVDRIGAFPGQGDPFDFPGSPSLSPSSVPGALTFDPQVDPFNPHIDPFSLQVDPFSLQVDPFSAPAPANQRPIQTPSVPPPPTPPPARTAAPPIPTVPPPPTPPPAPTPPPIPTVPPPPTPPPAPTVAPQNGPEITATAPIPEYPMPEYPMPESPMPAATAAHVPVPDALRPIHRPTPEWATHDAPFDAISSVVDTGSADVDANGNWIPPILRGIAPKEDRDKALLPRRRQDLGDD